MATRTVDQSCSAAPDRECCRTDAPCSQPVHLHLVGGVLTAHLGLHVDACTAARALLMAAHRSLSFLALKGGRPGQAVGNSLLSVHANSGAVMVRKHTCYRCLAMEMVYTRSAKAVPLALSCCGHSTNLCNTLTWSSQRAIHFWLLGKDSAATRQGSISHQDTTGRGRGC